MSGGLIYIKKRTIPGWLTCLILVMPLLLAFFIDFLHLPSFVKYLIDFAIVLVLALKISGKRICFQLSICNLLFVGLAE